MNLNDSRLFGDPSIHKSYSIPVDANDIVEILDLPDDEFFKPYGRSAEKGCAWVKLGTYVCEQRGDPKNTQGLSICDVFLTEATAIRLSKLSYYWLIFKSTTYLRNSSDKHKSTQFGMLSLNIAPNIVDATWARDDKIYIRKRR